MDEYASELMGESTVKKTNLQMMAKYFFPTDVILIGDELPERFAATEYLFQIIVEHNVD